MLTDLIPADAPNNGEVRRLAVAWCREHRGHPATPFVLRQLLEADSDADLERFVTVWLDENPRSDGVPFVLQALLRASADDAVFDRAVHWAQRDLDQPRVSFIIDELVRKRPDDPRSQRLHWTTCAAPRRSDQSMPPSCEPSSPAVTTPGSVTRHWTGYTRYPT